MRTGSKSVGMALAVVAILVGCSRPGEKPAEEEAGMRTETRQQEQEHANVRMLRQMYQSFAAGDVPGALALVDDSFVFHVPGTNLLAGDHAGKAAVGATYRKFRELTAGTFTLRPIRIFADDDYGVVIGRASATRNGKSVDEIPVQVWRFEGEEPVEMWLHPQDQHEFDEFWK